MPISLPTVAILLCAAGAVSACNQCSPTPSTPSQATSLAGAPASSATEYAAQDASALEVTEITIGTGAAADEGKIVSILYRGMFRDGRQFDQRLDKVRPLEFKIGSRTVIAGLEIGLKGMRVGGRRRLVIPADKAYGSQGFATIIPPETPLVFEVELLKVE